MSIVLSELLSGKKTVALGGHIRPDGDCVGSCMGLYLYLKEQYPQIQVDVYLDYIPSAYRFIQDTIHCLFKIRILSSSAIPKI